MSIVKKIEIDGKQVPFKASAAIPRIYRIKFNRDIYKDLRSLEKAVGEGDEQNSNLDLFSLEMFENIAYAMANIISCDSLLIFLIILLKYKNQIYCLVQNLSKNLTQVL